LDPNDFTLKMKNRFNLRKEYYPDELVGTAYSFRKSHINIIRDATGMLHETDMTKGIEAGAQNAGHGVGVSLKHY
jgi:hypothetical protein